MTINVSMLIWQTRDVQFCSLTKFVSHGPGFMRDQALEKQGS